MAYMKSGWWQVATGTNCVSMLIIKKSYPGPNGEVLLCKVVDKRQIVANTKKLVSLFQTCMLSYEMQQSICTECC